MEMERHQYCFSFMRDDTGGQKTKTFWGKGNREESEQNALNQARMYKQQYQNELNQKARDRARRRGDMYRPSEIRVQIVSYSFWK